jgi:hypothetical protein
MYFVGSVWWLLKDFGDGHGERKKYCILLNSLLDEGDYFWAALTTSKAARYHGETASPCGCPSVPCYRIEPGQEPCFPERTWVQFDNTHPVSREILDDWRARGKAGFIQLLASDRIRSVMNCAVKSQDLVGRAVPFIRKTLKSLNAANSVTRSTIPVPHMTNSTASSNNDSAAMSAEHIRAELKKPGICASTFCGLMKISEEELERALSSPLTAEFADNARLALELMSESK